MKSSIRLLLSLAALSFRLVSQTEIHPESSVYQVLVQTKNPNDAPREGSGFAIQVMGDPENPVVYLLTGAHVILGQDANDDTKIKEVVKSISVKYGSATTNAWEINLDSVLIHPQWKTTGCDFALLKIISAARRVLPLPLSAGIPQSGSAFKAYGYPPAFGSVTPIAGVTLGIQGQYGPEPWIVADATLMPSMSGGPVIANGSVFATVEGRPSAAIELKFLAPLTLASSFLKDHVPNLTAQIADPGFEVHTYVTRAQRQYTSQEHFEKRSSPINVGCGQSTETTVFYELSPELVVSAHSARWDEVDHIKSMSADSMVLPNGSIEAKGKIYGLDTQFLNCPGGGHATLVLSGDVIRRLSKENITAVEIGASELRGHPATFSLPLEPNVKIETVRFDVRPLGSLQPFASISLTLGGQSVEQTLFGTTFKVSSDIGSVAIAPESTATAPH